MIIATDDPSGDSKTMITTVPGEAIKLRKMDGNRVDFESEGHGQTNGLIVLEQKMPSSHSLRVRIWLVQSRNNTRKAGEVLKELGSNMKKKDMEVVFMEIYFLMTLQSGDHQLASTLREDVFGSKLFESNDPELIDRWRIYSAYFHYANSSNFYLAKVEYGDLLEDMPVYDKEREPEQVAILILQILYYIELKDVEAVKARRNAMKKYISNHFKENFSYRTRTFYKLLNIVAENDLDLKAIQVKTRYLLKKLPEVQVVSDVYTEIEVIPYEHLWDMISTTLQNSLHRQN